MRSETESTAISLQENLVQSEDALQRFDTAYVMAPVIGRADIHAQYVGRWVPVCSPRDPHPGPCAIPPYEPRSISGVDL